MASSLPATHVGGEPITSAISNATSSDPKWCTKQLILIRHGRSQWNEMLGAHKAQEWEEYERTRKGFREKCKEIVFTKETVGTGEAPKEKEGLGGLFRRRLTLFGGTADSEEIKVAASTSAGSAPSTLITPAVSTPSLDSSGNSLLNRSSIPARKSALRRRSSSADTLNKVSDNLNKVSLHVPRQSTVSIATNGEVSEKEPKGFWRGLRGGVRKATHVLSNATKFHQVDHALSETGLEQVRTLRQHVIDLVTSCDPTASVGFRGEESHVLLECKHWLVSPLLRALQTAGYALSPLYRRDDSLTMIVSPDAQEIMSSKGSFDCQGKPGNVGLCVFSRAVAKIALTINEGEKDPSNRELMLSRQDELGDVSRCLCSMDYSLVSNQWWRETKDFTKEDVKAEADRVQRLVKGMLTHEAGIVGLVAHSLLFMQIMQTFWPSDLDTQELILEGMRNGAPLDCEDPLKDKIMNCGTLIVTFKYPDPTEDPEFMLCTRIVDAEFLFDGHMESQEEMGDAHPETVEEALSFFDEAPIAPPLGRDVTFSEGNIMEEAATEEREVRVRLKSQALDDFLELNTE